MVMIFFGSLVFYISNSEFDIIQAREIVAVHSTMLLNIAGYESTLENNNIVVKFEREDFSNGVVSEIIKFSIGEKPSIQREKEIFIAVLEYTAESRINLINVLEKNNLKWSEEGPTIVMQFKDSDGSQKNFRSSIVRECVGYISIFAIIGLILGYPFASFRKKMIGLMVGAPIIYFANVIRITTIMMGVHDLGFWVFDLFHIFIWREGMILIALGVWFLWTRMPEKLKVKGNVKKG